MENAMFPVRVRSLRKRLRLNQKAFAAAAEVSQATVSRWESGKQQPDPESAHKLAQLGGGDPLEYLSDAHDYTPETTAIPVGVVGSVAAGQWLEAIEWPLDRRFYAYLPLESHFKDLELVGFQVDGQSMNLVYPAHSLIFVAGLYANHIEVRPGANVVVERVSKDGLHEATVKEFTIDDKGKTWLWPRSTQPEHQTPMGMDVDDQPDDIDYIQVIGVVVGSLQFEGYDDLLTVDGETHAQRLKKRQSIQKTG